MSQRTQEGGVAVPVDETYRHEAPSESTTATQLRWTTSDLFHLSPSGLPLSRISHAWDRKPQSPFARRRFKFGKLWKRTVPASAGSSIGVARKVTEPLSPTKAAVKKIRLEKGLSIGVRWEGLDCTERKIVTRSCKSAGDAKLVQLAADQIVEALHTNGDVDDVRDKSNTVLPYELEITKDDWEDVGTALGDNDVERAVENGEELVDFSEQMDDVNNKTPVMNERLEQNLLGKKTISTEALKSSATDGEPTSEVQSNKDDATAISDGSVERSRPHPIGENHFHHDRAKHVDRQSLLSLPSIRSTIALPPAMALPEGFVSPLKVRRRRPISDARRTESSRRQTLPMNFVPNLIVPDVASSTTCEVSSGPVEASLENAPHTERSITQLLEHETNQATDVGDTLGALHPEKERLEEIDEWEDIGVDIDEFALSQPGASAENDYIDQKTLQSDQIEPRLDEHSMPCRTESEVVGPKAKVNDIKGSHFVPLEMHPVDTSSTTSGLESSSSFSGTIHGQDAPRPHAPTALVQHTYNSEQDTVHSRLLEDGSSSKADKCSKNVGQTSQGAFEFNIFDHVNPSIDMGVPPEVSTGVVIGDEAVPQETSAMEETILSPDFKGLEHHSTSHRTPRCQSSSPRKRSLIKTLLEEKLHLIAFTPIKMAGRSEQAQEDERKRLPSAFASTLAKSNSRASLLEDMPLSTGIFVDLDLAGQSMQHIPQLVRSSSAPPESPRMSPLKVRQPRVSDDTALLQAFLNRAAETKSKSEQRLSVSKRESLENRRDSDSVRQALARSPIVTEIATIKPEIDVLKEMDPNSPSPRKQQFSVGDSKDARSEFRRLSEPVQTLAEYENDPLQTASPTPADKRQRRSTRRKKSPDMLSASSFPANIENAPLQPVPSSISIRSNSGAGIVVKKTEAQELAFQTRANTRKNKGSAVPPSIRLSRIPVEGCDQMSADDEDQNAGAVQIAGKGPRRKSVVWAETLAIFKDSISVPVVTNATAAIQGGLATSAGDMQDDFEAAEATINPRSRKLKPRLTPRPVVTYDPAGETSEIDVLAHANDTLTLKSFPEIIGSENNRSKAVPHTKRKSRIATPAKLRVAGTSLPPSTGEDDASTIQELSEQTSTLTIPAPHQAHSSIPTVAAKRPLASRLPAPSLMIKDNEKDTHSAPLSSLIASPPKKKLRIVPSVRQHHPPLLQQPLTSASGHTLSAPAFGASNGATLNFEASLPAENNVAAMTSPAKKGRALFTSRDNRDVDTVRRGSFMPSTLGSPAKRRGRLSKSGTRQ